MKHLLTMGMGLLLLLTAIFGTGCAPMPYQETYYIETEVIVVYEPPPYPDPGPICKNPPPPPPERHTPLTPQSNSGNPRTKTPRTGRDDDRAHAPRTRGDKQNLAQQAGHQTNRGSGHSRR
jgi:hypothetical protein